MNRKKETRERIKFAIIFGILIGLLSFYGFSYKTTGQFISDSEDNLVAYYPFDNGSVDMSNHSHNGVINNLVETEGVSGNAYYFNGFGGNVTRSMSFSGGWRYIFDNSAASFIEIPASSQFNFANQYTISAWVNIGGMDELYSYGIKRDTFGIIGKNSLDGWGLNVIRDNDTKNYFVQLGAHSCGNFISKTQLVPNRWYNIVITYDDTNNLNNGSIYINGVLDENANIVTKANCGDDTSSVVIGRYMDANLNLNGFNGTIDKIKIYDKALNSSDVKELMFEDYYCQSDIEIDGIVELDNAYMCMGENLVAKSRLHQCVEYDNGIDYKLNSSIFGYDPKTYEYVNHSDFCKNNTLVEYFCKGFYINSYELGCLNGCVDAKCNIVLGSSNVETESENSGLADLSGGDDSSYDATDENFWTSTYVKDSNELEIGAKVSGYLRSTERLKVDVKGQDHYVGVAEASETWAIIYVMSSVQKFQIYEGEEKKLDIDKDGNFDLDIKIKNIKNGVVSFSLERIDEPIKKEEDNSSISNSEEKNENFDLTTPFYIGVGIIFLLVLIIIVLILNNQSKKKKFKLEDITEIFN